MDRRTILYAIVGLAALAVAFTSYVVYTTVSGPDLGDTAVTLDVKILPTDRTLGNPKAPVTVVEYGAPVCPHCAHWEEEIFPQFKQAYIDTGKVFYVFRVLPIRDVDKQVEAIARCLPKDAYFPFIQMMFRNQPEWDPDGYQIDDQNAALLRMAKIFGMSGDQAQTCMNNPDAIQAANDVGMYAAQNYHIDSTPTFIVDKRIAPNMVTWQGLQDTLNAALKAKGAK